MAQATLGVGKRELMTAKDIEAVALNLGCHPAAVEAITMVESAGSGYFSKSEDALMRIKILPEPHAFEDYMPKAKVSQARTNGLAYANYAATRASGHYKRMGPASSRYNFFQRMISYDSIAAYMSISSGSFQIMGFNAEACGYKDAQVMFEDFCDSEQKQLAAFVAFLVKKGLADDMRSENYHEIERVYNGGGLGGAYATRMQTFATRLKAKQWANWAPHKPISDVKPGVPLVKRPYPGLLELGDSGRAVQDLQVKLGIASGDGKFGPLTQAAVIEFQKANNLVADGIVGRVTHELLWK